MITNKYINKIIIGVLIVAIIFTGMIMFFPNILDIKTKSSEPEYATKLFDKNKIISIDIKADENEWKSMLENATKEEYISCDVTINGTTFKSVGIRPKGNSSLSMVAGSDSDRFSFKFEFDHYIDGQTCFGLDKMVINNIQADATYMKEYLSYDLMSYMGVTTPLYSYTDVTLNGKGWGLYLAVESLEESFAQRNFGSDYGKLYKPEGMNMGRNGDKKGFGDMKAPTKNFGDDKGNTTNQSSNSAGNGTNATKQPPNAGADKTNTDTLKTNAANQTNSKIDFDAKNSNTTDITNQTQSPNSVKNTAANQAKSNSKTSNKENNDRQSGFPEDMPEGFGGDRPEGFLGDFPGGDFGGGPGGKSSGGADLKYTDDSISSYSNIFDYEVFDGTNADCKRVIEALKNLNNGTELEKYINVDATLKYFAANTVLVNLDSYFGNLKHNYYLYERNGQLTMLPWDYNLAFGGFQSGSASSAVNFPIDTPVSGVDMSERPILSKLLEVDEYNDKYHQYLQEIVDGYFNSGTFENTISALNTLISEHVKNDATAFYDYDAYTKAVPMIKEFGKLRAQSIQGQLDGTIPSTTDGQSSASDKLIEASSINLSTMGTMGFGGGGGSGGGMFPNGGMQPPDGVQQPGNGDMQPPNGAQQSGNGRMQPPDGAQQSFNMPDRDTAMRAMQIIQAANGEDLTQEQLSQLKELGLTDEQISSMKEMLNQRGQQVGFRGRQDRGGQAGGQQGDKPQQSPMWMENRQGQQSMLSGVDIYVIIISVVCLLTGLLFVIKFKRVRN